MMDEMTKKVYEAMNKSEALHNPTDHGQFIVNKHQLDKMHQILYGGHKQIKGTFSDDWANWTQSFVTNQNPDGDYVTGVTGRDGMPASLLGVYSSPFCDLVSLIGMVDYASPIRLGYYQGKTGAQGAISEKIGNIKEAASKSYARDMNLKNSMEADYGLEKMGLKYVKMAGQLGMKFDTLAKYNSFVKDMQKHEKQYAQEQEEVKKAKQSKGSGSKQKQSQSGRSFMGTKRGSSRLQRPKKPTRIQVPRGGSRGGRSPGLGRSGNRADGGNSNIMFSDVNYLSDDNGNGVTYSYGETKLDQENSYTFDWSNIGSVLEPETQIVDKPSCWKDDYSYV